MRMISTTMAKPFEKSSLDLLDIGSSYLLKTSSEPSCSIVSGSKGLYIAAILIIAENMNSRYVSIKTLRTMA